MLLRHDRAIALAATKAALVRWSDMLTLLLGVPLLLFVARAWVSDLPGDRARLVGLAACFVLGFALARLTASRIEYHRSDGVLAADALRPGVAARYRLAVVGAGLAIGMAGLFLVGAGGPQEWLPGAVPGLLAGELWSRIEASRSDAAWPRWLSGYPPARTHRLRKVAGLGVVAAGILLTLGALLEPPVVAAATLLTGVASAALLGRVEADRVQFMALVGHSSLATLRGYCLPLLGFFLPFALILALSLDWLVAGTGLGVGLLSLAIVAARVLAYRAYRRQFADWITALVLAGVTAAAITLPPAAPIVALAAILWLSKRASRVTWLLV